MKTITQISPRFNMLPEEWKSLWEGFLWYFILPSFIGYLENVTINLQDATTLSFAVLTPSVYTVIGIVALLKAQLVSLLKKYVPKNIVTTVVSDNKPVDVEVVPENNPTVVDPSILK